MEEKKIIQAICSVMNVKWDDVISKKRDRNLCDSRFAYCYFRYSEIGLSQIGRELGRTHATILHGIKQCNNLIDANDRNFVVMLAQIKIKINPQLKFNF
jgi:chromosomal replication initiation ATPase DnaA